MLRDDVLALLRQQEGRPLSGEAVSQALGVSRAAVWKAMERLRQEGYLISSAPRKGYWLERSPTGSRRGNWPGRAGGWAGNWSAWRRWTPPITTSSAGQWGRPRTAW